MRDRAKLAAWGVIFLWNFRDGQNHSKLEAETLKTDSYDTNFLPFFVVPLPLNSSDQFSVMRDSLKKISVMRDRYLPFATLSKGLITLPKMFTIAKSENSQDVETYRISSNKRLHSNKRPPLE